MKTLAFGLGLSVFAIGISAMIGYVMDLTPLYNWNTSMGMALPTAMAISLTGAAICILASRTHPKLCATPNPP